MSKLYRHVKTGGIYKILSESAFVEATYTKDGTADGIPFVVYERVEPTEKTVPRVWIRPHSEFFDGRFESIEFDRIDFDPIADIREFHEHFMLDYVGPPRILDPDLADFRYKFMHEEAEEWNKHQKAHESDCRFDPAPDIANYTYRLSEQLDALVDLLYVTLGAAYLQGFCGHQSQLFAKAWNRVHEKNMTKVRAKRESDSKRGSTYDVVKPEGWTPPDHSDLVEVNKWTSDK